MLPKITVDESKCTDPFSCRQCLLACPTRVLILRAKVPAEKFRQREYHDFKVVGLHLLACSACSECVRVCPLNAIRVSA